MIQLDAEGYRKVAALIGPRPEGRDIHYLGLYMAAKEVVATEACRALPFETVCGACAQLGTQMCVELQNLRTGTIDQG